MTSQRLNILDDFDFADLDDFGALDDFGTLDDFDVAALDDLADGFTGTMSPKATKKQLPCQVFTSWVDGPRSISHIKAADSYQRDSKEDFFLLIDESEAVGGSNLGPNPQSVMQAALNTFVVQTFTEGCRRYGIRLEKVEVTSTGKLNLWDFFRLNENSSLDYKSLSWTLAVKGDATLEEFQQVLESTFGVSPGAWNLVIMF
ncbi:MAG: hypothetical protein AAFQ57_01665 [Cyanobacteria bacterium J06626_14]